MKICVYDLSAGYEVRVIDLDNKSELMTYKMPPALVTEDTLHDNRKCTLFDPKNPDFSSFITMKDLSYSYDNDKLITLTEIMFSLCWTPNSNISHIGSYFNAVRTLVNERIKKKAISVDLTILLVPDALPLESQQRLLASFGRSRTRLLWHSIAVALGNEEVLMNFENSKVIGIVDEFSDIGLFTSKFEIKWEGERAVPCHKIYKKANGNISEWYYQQQEDAIKKSLDANVKKNRLKAAYKLHKEREYIAMDEYSRLPVKKPIETYNKYNIIKIKDVAQVISSDQSTVEFMRKYNHECDVVESGFDGAVRFVEYISKGQIPYYDECESFSVICQNKKEEIEYFELIKKNAYLPGGTKTEGIKIKKLSILKGNKDAQFYFHLGEIDDDNAQLKKYIQEFPIENPLEQDRALLLSPSVIPGQGYAEVLIEDNNRDKLFPPIELDWKHMEPAFEDGEKVTKAYLENHLKRSFPPDVPPVRTRFLNQSARHLKWEFDYLLQNGLLDKVFYNLSRWPYIADKDAGVKKFTRENTFGHYTKKDGHKYAFPKGVSIEGQEFLDEFEKLAKEFVDSKGNDSTYITWLAWCYQRYGLDGKLLPNMKKATDLIISSIDKTSKYSLRSQTASFIGNMIATEGEFERVFCTFDKVLKKKKTGINNWCRAVYQMLMYTPYIYANNNKIGAAAVHIMENLPEALKYAVSPKFSDQRVYMTLRVILYMLRRRICEKDFCKKGSPDGLYDKVVEALDDVKNKLIFCPSTKIQFIREIMVSIREFLDGKGVLDGIPAPDANDDGETEE